MTAIAGVIETVLALQHEELPLVFPSGYGGGIAASRFARAKQDVCVLERGREFLPGEFPDTKPEVAREVQADGPDGRVGDPTGLYDFRLNRNRPEVAVSMGGRRSRQRSRALVASSP